MAKNDEILEVLRTADEPLTASEIANGTDVRIVTARVSHDGSAARMVQAQYALIAIMDWCERHIGKALPVTCVKDYAMKELWDDRVVQVVKNIGHPVGYSPPVL